jgi:hypothetical protein
MNIRHILTSSFLLFSAFSCSSEKNIGKQEEIYSGLSHVTSRRWTITISNDHFILKIDGIDKKMFASAQGSIKRIENGFVFFPDTSGDYLFPIIDPENKLGYRATFSQKSGVKWLNFESCDINSRPHSIRLD